MKADENTADTVYYLWPTALPGSDDHAPGTLADAVILARKFACEVQGFKAGRANATVYAYPDGTTRIVPIKRRSAK